MNSSIKLAGLFCASVSTCAIMSVATAQTATAPDQGPATRGMNGTSQTSNAAQSGSNRDSTDVGPRAQDTAAGGADAAALGPEASSQAAAVSSDADIIVTGSRTIQNGNAMPTPVTVLSTQQLNIATPRSIVDALQTLPSVGGTNPRTAGSTNAAFASGSRTLDLRGVGTLRTLVLFDGVRVAPSSQGGEVNVDLIPSLLLQRVDIVTGGASAVYGSDAVAGVVNFITDRTYNGIKLDAQAGISKYGDAGEQKIGIAAGHGFLNGRVHVEGSYEYQNDDLVVGRRGRDWAKECEITGLGTAAVPYTRTCNDRNSAVSPFGRFANTAASGPLRDTVFKTDGVLSPFVHGTPTTSTGFESGGDGEYFPFGSLVAGSRTHKAFGRLDLDITDDIHFYAQALAAQCQQRGQRAVLERDHQRDQRVPGARVPTATGRSGRQNIIVFEGPVTGRWRHARHARRADNGDGRVGGRSWRVQVELKLLAFAQPAEDVHRPERGPREGIRSAGRGDQSRQRANRL
jgi:outer membrane receptor protein involved in Fe transport